MPVAGNMRRSLLPILLPTLLLLCACGKSDPTVPGAGDAQDDDFTPTDWTEPTHGNSAAPNYDVVFPADRVSRLDIVIAPSDWQAMLHDMEQRYGEFGAGGGVPPPIDGDENPIWASASVFHDDIEWYKVGVRFKGNSSLVSAWRSGIMKLALKLDFDEYEDSYPQIANQRFYGFRQLSFSNGFKDWSLMRERIAADIFRDAGVPVAHTAFYRIFIDYGGGPYYFGLYTAVEVVDDTVIENQYESDAGNLYKPDGPGASFEDGSFDEGDFAKKTNEAEGDWSDILALFDALHSPLRISDPPAWREGLESVLDVPAFLRWLAVNTVIQNWDSYGKMTHNYYLYRDPADGHLSWIPWDHNEALWEGAGGGHGDALSLALDEVGNDWPLIRYLVDDATYRAIYAGYVAETVAGPFESSRIIARYQAEHDLIAPFVVGDEGELSGYTFPHRPVPSTRTGTI